MSVSWSRRLIAALSLQRPGFDPISSCMRFMLGQVVLGQIILLVIRFSPTNAIRAMLVTHLHLRIALTRMIKERNFEDATKEFSFRNLGSLDINLEVLHPRCVGSITKNFVYYTYSQTQLYFTY